jgi:hypothetical protein
MDCEQADMMISTLIDIQRELSHISTAIQYLRDSR